MDLRTQHLLNVTRRHFLRTGSLGLGGLALSLLSGDTASAQVPNLNPLAPRRPHFAPKAKRVVYLHMAGSPPHLDLFDYKPELVRRNGQDCPQEFLRGRRFAFTTGSAQFGRPSMGSWVTYGLGSESDNLPGFIVLVSSGVNPSAGNSDWSSGFLPSVYQGVQCRSQGDPVLYVSNPAGMDRGMRRLSLDALRDLNEMQASELGSPETHTRIAQYELAFRMQTAVPEVMDINREPRHIQEMYGAQPGAASFA